MGFFRIEDQFPNIILLCILKCKKGSFWNQREFWCIYHLGNPAAGDNENRQQKYNINSFCCYPAGKLGFRYERIAQGLDEREANALLNEKQAE